MVCFIKHEPDPGYVDRISVSDVVVLVVFKCFGFLKQLVKFFSHLLLGKVVAVLDVLLLEMKYFSKHVLEQLGSFVCVVVDDLLKTIPLKAMVDEYVQLWLLRRVSLHSNSHWLKQG